MTHTNDRNYKIAASVTKLVLGVLILMLGWFGNEIWSKQQMNTGLIYSHETSIGTLSGRVTNIEVALIDFKGEFREANKTLDSMNVALQIIASSIR